MYYLEELLKEINFQEDKLQQKELFNRTVGYKRDANFLTNLWDAEEDMAIFISMFSAGIVPLFAGIHSLINIISARRGARKEVREEIKNSNNLEKDINRAIELKDSLTKIKHKDAKINTSEILRLTEELNEACGRIDSKLNYVKNDVKKMTDKFRKDNVVLDKDDEAGSNSSDADKPTKLNDTLSSQRCLIEQEIGLVKNEFIAIGDSFERWDVLIDGKNLKDVNLDIIVGLKRLGELNETINKYKEKLERIVVAEGVLFDFKHNRNGNALLEQPETLEVVCID